MALLTTPTQTPLIEFGDAALIAAMIEVEAALARVQGELGIIPPDAATRISSRLATIDIEADDLAPGMAAAGVPVPALVARLRKGLDDGSAGYLHWGATSQDILDTAMVLCLRRALDRLQTDLTRLGDQLRDRMLAERATPVLARTRFQAAVPTVLGLRFAGWLAPLTRYRERLAQARPRLLTVQFGGAAGNLAALGDHGMAVASGLAKALGLGLPPMPWHAQRDAVFEIGSLAAGLAGHLGKIGLDTLIASQDEIGEIRLADGGPSSTMPNKRNPVTAEALVTTARLATGQLAALHGALLHAQERDGSAWALEWSALPALLELASTALHQANGLLSAMAIDRQRMQANLDHTGLAYAEALSFVLARQRPRSEALALAKRLVEDAQSQNRPLFEVLRDRPAIVVDGAEIRAFATDLPAAGRMIDAVAISWRNFETSPS